MIKDFIVNKIGRIFEGTGHRNCTCNGPKRRNVLTAALIFALVCGTAAVLLRAPHGGTEAASDSGTASKAENVTYKVELVSEKGKDLSGLKDNDRYSKVQFSGEDVIRASLPDSAGFSLMGVYVVWDVAPDKWSIDAAFGALDCGGNGFLHEYVEFPESVRELVLHIPANTVICDLVFYNVGELPSSVQRWQPPYERADFLLFPSHGDDEHLFFGGIMPYYGGELGYKVQVAYMTNHAFTELYRVHEQLDGLWTVGITAYPCFGDFVDEYSKTYAKAAEMYGEENVERWQVEMIRRFRPYVVVGHDFEGEYGHGAHRINGTMLQKSVPDAADASRFPESAEKYGVWDTPKFYSHLYNRDNGVIIEWGEIYLSKFGGVSALEMAKKGYLCHDSQQWTSFKVRTDGYGDCRQFGLYRSLVGDDVLKNDLLENIVFEPEPTEVPTEEPTEEPTPEPTAAPTDIPPETTALPEETEKAGNDATAVPVGTNDPGEQGGNERKKDKSIPVLLVLLALSIAALAALLVYMRRRNRGKKTGKQ